jgi:hypothetical protein
MLTVSKVVSNASFDISNSSNVYDHYSADTKPDVIPVVDAEGSANGDWVVTRKTTNWQTNNPVTDVTSDAMTCYELSPGTPASETQAVAAGDTVTFTIDPAIYHPGPVDVYMAKAPTTAAAFDGAGDVWFKIYEDPPPEVTSSALVWTSTSLSPILFP